MTDTTTATRTRVVHYRERTSDAVYVGRRMPHLGLRDSRWRNEFHIGRHGDRDAVIALFWRWVRTSDDERAVWIRAHVRELRGKTLVCWCAPDGGATADDALVCHGQVLAILAEEE